MISTHVLDTSRGRPARGVGVVLAMRTSDGAFADLAAGVTDDDGRLTNLLGEERSLLPGVYRLTFQTGEWFASEGVAAFYPQVDVTFELTQPGQHYHVPLLLSPFGYATYRGS